MDEKTNKQLEDDRAVLKDRVAVLQAKIGAINEELNERARVATTQRILDGIEDGQLPALVKLATLKLGASVGKVEIRG